MIFHLAVFSNSSKFDLNNKEKNQTLFIVGFRTKVKGFSSSPPERLSFFKMYPFKMHIPNPESNKVF